MKKILIAFVSVVFFQFAYSQTVEESINQIRADYKWINEQQDYTVIVLNNEDFLDFVTDNGAELKGFFKDGKLYKMVETIGLSSAVTVTEYYFWDDNLLFIYGTEKTYKQILNDDGEFVELDYANTELQYEIRLYYADKKEIRKLEKGTQLNQKDYLLNVETYVFLLKNRIENQSEYDKIQGSWVSLDDEKNVIEFEGLIKTEFYSNEFIDQSKIRIAGTYLYCWTGEEKEESKYEIISLSSTSLELLFLPAGKVLKYKKQ